MAISVLPLDIKYVEIENYGTATTKLQIAVSDGRSKDYATETSMNTSSKLWIMEARLGIVFL